MSDKATGYWDQIVLQQKMLAQAAEQLKPKYVRFAEQLEAATHFANRLSLSELAVKALQGRQESQLLMNQMLEARNRLSVLAERALESRQWNDLLSRAHVSWTRLFKSEEPESLQWQMRMSVAKAQSYAIASERSVNRLLGSSRPVAQAMQELATATQLRMDRFASRYKEFLDSYLTLPQVVVAPREIVVGAGRELFLHETAVEASGIFGEPVGLAEEINECRELIESDVRPCIDLLGSVDASLVEMMQGAWDSLKGGRADRGRHVLTSLRELTSHLIRYLSPDNQIEAWRPPNENDEYYHQGKPTRKCRLEFILKDVLEDPVKNLLKADIKAHLELLTHFNKLHGMEVKHSDEQLRVVIYRVESFVTFLLQVRT